MSKMNFDDIPKTTWHVYKGENFGIEVVAWHRETPSYEYMEFDESGWRWNVYAYIYNKHPIYSDIDSILDLPFHGGVSYKERFQQEPMNGIQYDWQYAFDFIKVGSDYAHDGDTMFRFFAPTDGIPESIKFDVKCLVSALEKYKGTQNGSGELSTIAE